jgi:ABC-type multidrug transport system ATPase subunit
MNACSLETVRSGMTLLMLARPKVPMGGTGPVPLASGPMIIATGLGKRFRTLTAVHDLTFTVGDGEIFGLLGPNGAGKTTSIRMLAGLIAPSAGSARINDLQLGPDSQRIRALTGVLTETPGLHDKLTARQNLGYYGRLYGLRGAALRRAVDRYLDVVGLADEGDRRVGGFSKGMRQKVAIARALLHEPEVLYLDEPTSALDPSAAKTVRDFVATLRDAGRSIVVCTHNLDEAERLCDRIGIMRGTLLRVDTPAGSEVALVDVCVCTLGHVGAKALWQPATLRELYCAFAEPHAIGLSSIAGLLRPAARTAPDGVVVRLAAPEHALQTVLAPIAPGVVAPIGVRDAGPLAAGRPRAVGLDRGTVAVDGEREIEFGPATPVTVTLAPDGPRVLDVRTVLAAAAHRRLLERDALEVR